ncbi:MAG TPA: hypothetical protein VE338_05805 [Ktedonobacterales bacterium]|nr:hypothetical protein [Ktedonobacterales bacterium]
MRNSKRTLLVGTSIASLVALFVAALFIYGAGGVHADAATSNPNVLTDDSALNSGHPQTQTITPRGHLNGQAHARFGSTGVDSVPSFNEHYFEAGFDSNGNPNREWFTNTLGNPAQIGGVTNINAPIVPVKIELLNPDGSVAFTDDPMSHLDNLLQSPIFQNAQFSSSSTPTQYTDAVQRAEYASSARSDWHTMLVPQVKTERTMQIPSGKYFARLNGDGSVRYVLLDAFTFENALFPATATDTTTPMGAAEHAGDITTKDVSTFFFNNAYLYVGSRANCCILGFHTYDYEPGDASNGNVQRDYVVNYSSWISAGLFGSTKDAPQDVTAVSHELSETFNDPFVAADGIHNITPWWQSSFNCQNNLEDGDVIEGLPNDNYVMSMNGFTYHVQNEALHQWFEGVSPSDATGGGYSYPDPTTLTSPAVSQPYNCGQ